MNSKLLLGIIPVMLILTLATIPVLASPAVQPTGKPFQLTTGPHYDRNPSFFQASDGSYWLFFTRGRDPRGVRGLDGYEPDLDYYDIYYKTARSIPQLQKAPESMMPRSPPDNAQRDIAALQTNDGKIWVFASTGLGPGTQRSIYYYVYEGGVWSGPLAIPNTDYAAHIDALQSNGKIWVFFDVGYSLYVLYYNGGWSIPVLVASEATLGKAIVDSGTFYVVWVSFGETRGYGTGVYLSNSANGIDWASTGTPIASWPDSSLTNWDPVLIKDKDTFRLFWAPSNSEQFIATSTSTNPTNPSSWSAPVRVTTASYGGIGWWDFWPEPYKKGRESEGSLCMFYTSERNSDGTAMIDGNIWVYMAVPLTD